jgi:hypothetical protein
VSGSSTCSCYCFSGHGAFCRGHCYSRGMSLVRWTLLLFTLGSQVAHADNSPERALRVVRKSYLPKVNGACDLSLSVEFAGASLRKHDPAIGGSQLHGGGLSSAANLR